MKPLPVIYMAHPVTGNVAANLARARRWLRWIFHNYEVAPVAHWISYFEIADDEREQDRDKALRSDAAVVARCDQIWAVGGAVSVGMQVEITAAAVAGVPLLDLTHLGPEPPKGRVDLPALRRVNDPRRGCYRE